MRILMLGVNHRTAPVELRERLAMPGERLGAVIDQIRTRHPTAEVVILSTCNRTEIYLARPIHESPTIQELTAFVADCCGVGLAALTAAIIHRENEQAVGQLFRVCSGLDSMVLGEPQILGQVKRAYEYASARRAVGPVLHKIFQQAIGVAKQARTATGIDSGRVSVGSVAVDLARGIFERFDDKTVVGIGAGEMAKLTLTHFHALRPGKLWLANRSLDRAQSLANRLRLGQPGSIPGGARTLEALDELLVEADIVLTGTGATEPIITAERFHPLLKRRRARPLFIIDIAMPRDVEAQVGSLKNVYLYNIDHLQEVVEQTRDQRSAQAEACEKIVVEAVQACMAEIQNRDIGNLIRLLRDRLHDLGRIEQERTIHKLGRAASAADMQSLLEEHTHRLVNKILHLPLSQLDRRQADAPLGFYAVALRRLFDLKDETPPVGPSEVQLPLDQPSATPAQQTSAPAAGGGDPPTSQGEQANPA